MPTSYYVADNLALGASSALVSGPFATYALAEQDRRELNIAEDCSVVTSREVERYALDFKARTAHAPFNPTKIAERREARRQA